MRDLLDKLSAIENIQESSIPELGDEIGFSFSPDLEIVTEVVGFTDDGIVVELDQTGLNHLTENGAVFFEGEIITEGLRDPKDNPCWKGYKPVGTKKKGGRTVPNCVPKESVSEDSYTTEKQILTRIRQIMHDRKLSGTESNAGELHRLKQKLKDIRNQQDVKEGPEENKKWRDQARDASKEKRPWSPTNLPNYKKSKEQDVEERMDPEKRARLDDLIDAYRDSTDPHDYYDRDYQDPEEIIDMIRQEFGDKIAGQVEAGADKMHFSRPGHTDWKADPLGWKKPVDRMTKAGKMYKQDSDFRKNTIKSRYKLSGRSSTSEETNNDEDMTSEAEYRGKNVPLGKKLPGDVKKSKVYVRKPNGNIVKVNFGDKKMRIKKSNPKRRKSFRARHNCKNPGPRWKARYWSCRSW